MTTSSRKSTETESARTGGGDSGQSDKPAAAADAKRGLAATAGRLGWGKKLLFLAVIAGAALLLAEAGVRCLSPLQLGFRYENGKFKPPKEFDLDRSRNALLLHDVDHGPKPPGATRVVLLGDSYVAAWSVPIPATVGRRLEHHLHAAGAADYEVIAIGQPEWGQREQLRALQDLGPWAQPDWVVTLFLPFNDVRDNSPALERIAGEQYRAMARMRPGWTHVSADDAPWFWVRSSVLNQLLSHRLAVWSGHRGRSGIPIDYFVYAAEQDDLWQDAWRQTEELIVQIRERSSGFGAKYAIVSASAPHGVLGADRGLRHLVKTYPGMREFEWDLDGPDRRLARICRLHGIPLLLLEPIFRAQTVEKGRRLHWQYDGHWNIEGNDLAGQRIAQFILASETGGDARR
ncbi:MAG: hypothetical protein JSV19_08620 [Phycisphaerales bacterium]|nr:MAG: hypothetical protein JSV19_08620 [Phycisphaerales bacterium]